MNNTQWTPSDWRSKPAWQLPSYEDEEQLSLTEARLARAPALVHPDEVNTLKSRLAQVAKGEAFLLQGGDCAETFHDRHAVGKTYTLLQHMATHFVCFRPVVTLGRMAGQFAKPRSSPTENHEGQILPNYRGDAVNAREFTKKARASQPERLLEAYHESRKRLEILHNLAFHSHREQGEIQKNLPDGVYDDGVHAQKRPDSPPSYRPVIWPEKGVYISHEALLLNYEEALTRRDPQTGLWMGLSAHMLWVGNRTRQVDGAHVNFVQGITNPVGVKCGPSVQPDELLRLIDCLDPHNEPGRLILIIRSGVQNLAHQLPKLARHVKQEGRSVIWCCDPMHGNTYRTQEGYKTRSFEDIVSETRSFIDILQAEGLYPGGLHVEMTGRPVTECWGGQAGSRPEDVPKCYETACDPRLNPRQAGELSRLIADDLKERSL